MLDLIGYKSDKLPKATKAMNSVNIDAQHAYFAAFCDYLITQQDSHLTSKAQALYHEFNVSTKIISTGEAIEELSENRNDDLVTFLREQIQEDNVERREEGKEPR